jgi:hypothetical protein
MPPDMQPVESGHIKSIGYDAETQILTIKFKPRIPAEAGAIHQYRNVPIAKHAELMAAESKGQHFNLHIRNNEEHPSHRIDH